jgi:ABC-2 type transport system ATP-binding protein
MPDQRPDGPDPVLRLSGVDHRYGARWALRGCSLELPRGRIAALVGPNGAGKSTLLLLVTGLLRPTGGTVDVLGADPGRAGMPAGASFLAQSKPLYRGLTVSEMLRAGAVLNRGHRWDAGYAARLVDAAGIDPAARIGVLSPGLRARVALALALGRRPDLLLLDEPLAELDPLARRRVLGALLAEAGETGMTVLMSSHVLTDLEDSCDHLVLLRDGRVRLAGDIAALLAEHRRLTGPAGAGGSPAGPPAAVVVHESVAGRQRTALVRGGGGSADLPGEEPTLEDLVLGYLEADEPAERGAA